MPLLSVDSNSDSNALNLAALRLHMFGKTNALIGLLGRSEAARRDIVIKRKTLTPVLTSTIVYIGSLARSVRTQLISVVCFSSPRPSHLANRLVSSSPTVSSKPFLLSGCGRYHSAVTRSCQPPLINPCSSLVRRLGSSRVLCSSLASRHPAASESDCTAGDGPSTERFESDSSDRGAAVQLAARQVDQAPVVASRRAAIR
jgi:hypothetical protein